MPKPPCCLGKLKIFQESLGNIFVLTNREITVRMREISSSGIGETRKRYQHLAKMSEFATVALPRTDRDRVECKEVRSFSS